MGMAWWQWAVGWADRHAGRRIETGRQTRRDKQEQTKQTKHFRPWWDLNLHQTDGQDGGWALEGILEREKASRRYWRTLISFFALPCLCFFQHGNIWHCACLPACLHAMHAGPSPSHHSFFVHLTPAVRQEPHLHTHHLHTHPHAYHLPPLPLALHPTYHFVGRRAGREGQGRDNLSLSLTPPPSPTPSSAYILPAAWQGLPL